MLIDTHMHLICDEYKDIKSVIYNANNSGVKYLIVAGTNNIDNNLNVSLSKSFDCVFLTVGIHPEFCDSYNINDLEELIIYNKDKVVGIGEIGLDYHYDGYNKDAQIKLFRLQLDLAVKYNLPVVIHSRDAIMDTIAILKNYKLKGVIHCFSGSYEIAIEYIKLGYLLGIGGVVTFKNSKLSEVLKKISINNLVLETDSPFLSPIRGDINEPKNICIVAEKLASIYNINYDDVAYVTTNNALEVFSLNKGK